MDNMPPEPPPLSSEADYTNSPRRSTLNTALFETHQPFGVNDIPIPAHLLSLPETPDLNAAWAKVLSAEHEPIPKRGYNKHFQYNYATADDIRMYVGQELGKNGLHYEQHTAGFTVWSNLIRVTYYFVIRHSSGQSSPPIRYDELARTTSEKGTPDDKALGKAGVLALKNFTKMHFSIDTGDLLDDPDSDGPVVDTAPARRIQQPARQAASATGKPQEDRSFADRATSALNAEGNGTKWLKVLDVVYSKAESMDDIGFIRTIDSYKATMANAPTLIKQRIEEMEKAAVARVTPQFETLTGTAKSTATTADAKLETERVGKPVNTVEEAQAAVLGIMTEVGKAMAAEKPESEDDGWPGPKD